MFLQMVYEMKTHGMANEFSSAKALAVHMQYCLCTFEEHKCRNNEKSRKYVTQSQSSGPNHFIVSKSHSRPFSLSWAFAHSFKRNDACAPPLSSLFALNSTKIPFHTLSIYYLGNDICVKWITLFGDAPQKEQTKNNRLNAIIVNASISKFFLIKFARKKTW